MGVGGIVRCAAAIIKKQIAFMVSIRSKKKYIFFSDLEELRLVLNSNSQEVIAWMGVTSRIFQ